MFAFIDEKVWQSAVERVVLFVPHLATAIVLLIVFWIAARVVAGLIERFGAARKMAGDAMFVLSRAAKLSLLAVGVITALGTIGVDVTAMVAGLGLTGFAVGFALKDIISNSLAGILILIYKPFQRQDRILIPAAPVNLEGHVVHIDLRYTTLQLPDRKVLIPNANLFTNPIMVFQAPPPEAPAAAPK
ncbi:MAG TPA: mechanosensitive ion channel domain-containing protein [Pirellulales bacterium]